MRWCVLLVLLALLAGDPSAADSPICPIVCVKEFASYFEPLRLNALEVLTKEIDKLNRTIAACRRDSSSQLETSVRTLVEALNEDRHLEIELQRVKNESDLEKRDLQARLSVALTDAANATEKTRTLVSQLEQLRNQPCNATNDDEEEIKLALLTLNGKSYYFEFNATGNWTEAKKFCEKNNMHLATLMSEAELENLNSHLSDKGESYTYWVSASDANQPLGQFKWLDGTDLQKESTLWDKERGQPDNFGDGHQTCVGIGSEGRLVDDPCDSHQNKLFICEQRVN
ncbi:hepatic lectin-like [Cloeon dipterum]|uniref:hepatic lectin-like n=1 Tax=Cloeon dipterum TaxID=197152 RepID=UPI003220639A